MNEVTIRKVHRTCGVILAILFIVQGVTGLVLTGQHLFVLAKGPGHTAYGGLDKGVGHEAHLIRVMEAIHAEGGLLGGLYRTVVGLGLLIMAATGVRIYLFVRSRSVRAQKT